MRREKSVIYLGEHGLGLCNTTKWLSNKRLNFKIKEYVLPYPSVIKNLLTVISQLELLISPKEHCYWGHFWLPRQEGLWHGGGQSWLQWDWAGLAGPHWDGAGTQGIEQGQRWQLAGEPQTALSVTLDHSSRDMGQEPAHRQLYSPLLQPTSAVWEAAWPQVVLWSLHWNTER